MKQFFNKKTIIPFTCLLFLFLIFPLIFVNAQDSYQINANQTITIDKHGVCRITHNQTGSTSTFIPVKASDEWMQFRTNRPAHINLSNCMQSYTITINANGGSCAYTSELVAHGSNSSPPNCTRSGYTLTGYTRATSCSAPGTFNTSTGVVTNVGCSQTITANYTAPTRTLTVNSSGILGLSIKEDHYVGAIGTTYWGTTNYSRSNIGDGTMVELVAPSYKFDSNNQVYYNFSSWSGCDSVGRTGNRTCYVSMTANKTVTANYTYIEPVASGSLSFNSSTQNSITLNYSYSNGTNVSLFLGNSYIVNLGTGSASGPYTVSGLSPGQSYNFYLRNGTSNTSALLGSASGSTQAPSASGSLSCYSSTQNSITLYYSFSNGTNVSLFRDSTYLSNFGSGSGSNYYTVSGLSPGQSYNFYLRNGTSSGSPLISSAGCSTQSGGNGGNGGGDCSPPYHYCSVVWDLETCYSTYNMPHHPCRGRQSCSVSMSYCSWDSSRICCCCK